jgi:hypothetical protein
MTAVSNEAGRGWLPLKYEDGPDFCTVTFATGAAFALTVHPERMKLMEAALSHIGGLGADEIAQIIATKCLDPRAIDSSGKLFWKKSQWREAQQAATAILALLSRNKSQS